MTLIPPTRVEKLIVTLALAGTALGCVLSYSHPDFFHNYYAIEDGPIEWITAITLAAVMVLCLKRAIELYAFKSKLFIAMTVFMGLVFFFGAGEELSWGQRIFSIESPEFFQQHNAQGETNFHNLVVGDTKINKLIFSQGIGVMFLLYIAVVTPLYRYKKGFADFIDKFAIPIPANYQILCYIIIIVLAQILTDSPKKGELNEFGGSLIIFLNFLRPVNRHIFAKKLGFEFS